MASVQCGVLSHRTVPTNEAHSATGVCEKTPALAMQSGSKR